MSIFHFNSGIFGKSPKTTAASIIFRVTAKLVLAVLVCSSTIALAQQKSVVNMDEAIDLAIEHNHALKAARTTILQNQAQEITAYLRPNPVFQADSQFMPFFTPSQFTKDNLDQVQQFDIGASYLFERGGKRNARLLAAQDQTSVTKFQVADNERALVFN